jgi:hypothetical protein
MVGGTSFHRKIHQASFGRNAKEERKKIPYRERKKRAPQLVH